jgi:AcrR family transcriptional regulator
MGLRERKKRETRERIVEVGRELFVTHGFEQTSIRDIAERADIAVSTLFGYFPNKSEIFFAGYAEIVADFVRTIETRTDGETAIDATVRWHREGRRAKPAAGAEQTTWWLELRRLVDADPVLQGMERERYGRAESTLARAIADDLGDRGSDLRPQLIAATKVALMFTLSRNVREVESDDWAATAGYVDECLRAAASAIASVPLPRTASARGALDAA